MLFRNPMAALQLSSEPIPLRGHIPALDAVRGIAILIVTAYRFRPDGTDNIVDRWLGKGLILGEHGVDLFFVLSGFLITGILWDTKEKSDYFRSFYIRRALRIFPLYYAALILSLLILPALVPTNSFFAQPHPYQGWLWFHASNLIMSWEGAWLYDGFDHFWSLAVEEHFYLVWPIVIWLASRRQALWLCGLCGVIGFATRSALVVAGHASPAADIFTLCRIDSLAIGAWLALFLRGSHDPLRVRVWAKAAAVLGLSAGLAAILFRKITGGMVSPLAVELVHFSCYTWISIGCAGLIVLALGTRKTSCTGVLWNHPALIAAGKYSYGWYVFQGLIRPDFMRLGMDDQLNAWTGIPGLGGVVQMIVGGTVSLLLALVSWKILESPLLTLKDRFAPRTPQPQR